ncbi:butyrophilin subfamily 1 member A1-like isoform X3 [Chiloscyllium plagiosum]|uniref:butyrophilin subfamily 1 member A1-like isoform X3 n=1 Tax=Chiloscyllium plagiosum TaxID=36176 RepID=UPI001CB80147|nr:butyrophilin subfamily 1 member A1-like isoform X3 [Chiloscyllium plagiosum]
MSWRSLIPILLILQSSVEGTFIVTTSEKPTVVTVGQDVVLECQLIPAAAPEEMEVRWFRKGWQRIVHMYRKGKDEPDEQMKEYFGRTELFHDEFGKGNVSLLLRNVTVKDNGTFRCFVVSKALDAEGPVELKVGNEVFPTVSGWLVAFWVIFIILLAVFLPLLYLYQKYQRQHHQIRTLMMRPAINEYEALNAKLNQACASAEKEKSELLKQIENEKQAAKLECEKLLHLIEWDKMLRCAVSVTLDPETANGHLEVSPDRLSVKDGGGWRNVTENPKRFERYPFVVASEGFRAGAHYWEVEVGDSNNWDLGVARALAQRKGRVELSEENGYWVMGRYWEKYKVKNVELTLDRKPARVGVFLNLKEALVSFHDAETKTQLYAFQTHLEEEGEEIFPFFCPWRSQEPLKITPVTPED